MPIPYLGSKRKSAGKIYQTIKNFNSEGEVLVDLFCGGFAVSEYFLKNSWSVIANDKNKYVIALLNKTIFEGLNEKIVTEFITRKKFTDIMVNKNNYDDWYVGYTMCVWSFGNNQKGYLFGKDVEKYKQAGHELVISKNPSLIKELIPELPQKYIDGILKQETWQKRRLALCKVSRALKIRILELQQLEQLERLQRLEQLERLQRLEQLEQLERLQQLEQLERLQQLEQLHLLSGDYRNVEIPKGAVVYCDPPYEDTEEYSEGGFNHVEFWEYIRKLSKTNNVYVSSYQAPDDFKKILVFSQNSTYQGGANKNQPSECLFTIIKNNARSN